MPSQWTEERRRQQAERIRKTRPWERSTGPTTKAGKERSCLNALKHGRDSRILAPYRDLLALNAAFIKLAQDVQKLETLQMVQARSLLKNELIEKSIKTKD